MTFDATATALAARFAAGAMTAPAGEHAIRVATANPPNQLPGLPAVVVFLDTGDWTHFPGKRDGTHTFLVRFYLTQTLDIARENARLRKWLDVLAYQLRDSSQLGGIVSVARISTWRAGILSYALQDYSGLEFAVTVVTNEAWAAVA